MSHQNAARPTLRRFRCSLFAVALAVAGALTVLAGSAQAQEPNSAARLIIWTNCTDLPTLTDSQLDTWKSRGVDGFVCESRWLSQMGGSQDFTGDPNASLAGSNYDLERSLRDSHVIARMAARGMKAYLGAYLVNYKNTATPLANWFDDSAWSGTVLPSLRNLAAAAKMLGFAGVAFDQELYPQSGGVTTATWDWSYPGNTHSEDEVRAKAKQRGSQIMQTLLSVFPDVEIAAYDVELPGEWAEVIYKEIYNHDDVYGGRLDINFWDGLSSVEGYRALRLYDATFYKSPQVGSWDSALQYEDNKLYTSLSQKFSNWDYASSRFSVSPFAWIDPGPSSSSFDDAKSVSFVTEQLNEFSQWGMGGEFADYAYNGLSGFNYSPYASAMASASTPRVVDSTPPDLTVDQPGPNVSPDRSSVSLSGTTHDDFAIRAVRWSTDHGPAGTADLTWNTDSGDYKTGYAWHTTWSAADIPLAPGANTVTVTAEDTHGLDRSQSFSVEGPPLPPPPPPAAAPLPKRARAARCVRRTDHHRRRHARRHAKSRHVHAAAHRTKRHRHHRAPRPCKLG